MIDFKFETPSKRHDLWGPTTKRNKTANETYIQNWVTVKPQKI